MIEVVDGQKEQGDKQHYIPHHAIIKPENNTTKLRVVYNASAKTKKSDASLNECLHRGPVILEDIYGLLMRFRTRKIGTVAGIEKAFLQIGLSKERDVKIFLWLKNINLPVTPTNVITYRLTRVLFCIISSPLLLGATVKHHQVNRNETDECNIHRDIFVDNLITGVNSKEETS